MAQMSEKLWHCITLAQARASVQRVWKELLSDTVLPAASPWQRSVQQSEEPLKELVKPRLEKHPQSVQLKESLSVRQQSLPAPRGEEKVVVQRWEPRVPVELPQPVVQVRRKVRRCPKKTFPLVETVNNVGGENIPSTRRLRALPADPNTAKCRGALDVGVSG